ncbi:hypothetical protein SETIT_8G188500v2 [Setaria italica]|uniref:Uncharacterized protein n=1 Tax=Setaria italica TaxID=4555 RepID=A0A368S9J8_SETIT|nr:hypothetical protein SETIT_8G188500v2 [Setaria italica]
MTSSGLLRVLALLFFLFLVAVHLATPRSRTEKLLRKLPSPPFELPVIAHLHLIGSLPHHSLSDLAKRHGPDVMLLRLGAVPTLVVSSPRAAKAVLRTHDHVFASRPHSAVADILFYGSTDVSFTPYGEYWRRARKDITTHLLTAAKVRSNRAAREQEVRLVLARVRAAAAAGTAIDVSEIFIFFANDIVCQAMTGRLPREQGQNQLSWGLGGFNLDDYFPSLARFDLVSAKAVKHIKRWDDLLDSLIDKHKSKTMDCEDEGDFIDVLLSVQQAYGLTRDNIKAILMDMFEAGTDTTYIALDYTMAELMQKPRVVMKESMRVHAPAPLMLPHFFTAECDAEGYTIPSGTRVILNVWALGRDPTSWKSPEEFMPDRFIEEAMDAASDFQGNDFRFLPFGSGRRMCPAINFTKATFEIILANLVYHFNWELPPGSTGIDMTESYGVDVHRKEKLLLIPRVALDV